MGTARGLTSKSMPLNNTECVTAHVNQQKSEKERYKHLDAVNLDDTKLSHEQKNKVIHFLNNWQHVFLKVKQILDVQILFNMRYT